MPPTDVLPYYNAYVLLAKMFSSSDKLLQFRLLPGQLISFNNRRILHGRNSFSSKGGVRHLQVHTTDNNSHHHCILQGAYINIDEYNSKFHVLNEIFGTGQAKRVFNHSSL